MNINLLLAECASEDLKIFLLIMYEILLIAIYNYIIHLYLCFIILYCSFTYIKIKNYNRLTIFIKINT